jgi:hypothetical protein
MLANGCSGATSLKPHQRPSGHHIRTSESGRSSTCVAVRATPGAAEGAHRVSLACDQPYSAVRCVLSQQEFHGDHQTVEVVRSRRNLVFDADRRADQRLCASGTTRYATSGDGVDD